MDNEKLISLLVSVIDGAKEVANTPPLYDAGRHTVYQLYEPTIAPLREDLQNLDEATLSDLRSALARLNI